MNKYYNATIGYDIYLNITDIAIFISVPCYEVFNKECISDLKIKGKYIFWYYEFMFENKEINNYEVIIMSNRFTCNVREVNFNEINEDEYRRNSIRINRKELLREKYLEKNSKNIVFKYIYDFEERKMFDKIIFKKLDLEKSGKLEIVITCLKWFINNFDHDGRINEYYSQKGSEILRNTMLTSKRLNCRNMAVAFNDMMLSLKIKSRIIICLQKEINIDDCHFMVEIYCDQCNNWIAIDTSYGMLFRLSDKYLSIAELRELIATDNEFSIIQLGEKKKFNEILYKRSMQIKFYRFIRQINSDIYYENNKENLIELVPNINSCNDYYTKVDCPNYFWGS